MAGHFPYAYFDESGVANNYGGTDILRNVHYRIHDNSNNPLFTSDGSIDVYKFRETSADNSAQRAYALIIIKNTGSSQSLLQCTEIALNTASQNANFSLVTQISDLTSGVDFDGSGGEVGFLSPADYQSTVLNALSGTDLTGPEPIGYLKINVSSGTIEEGDFAGSAVSYIPFYDPADITNNSYSISADNFGGGTVYSQYAAFLLKCDPISPTSIQTSTDAESLVLSFNIGQEVKFYLNVDSFSTGQLNYQQGKVLSEPEGFLFTPNASSSVKTFGTITKSEPNVDFTTQYIRNNAPNAASILSQSLSNYIYLGYIPYGTFIQSSGFFEERQTLRIFDTNSAATGVRIQLQEGIDQDGYFPIVGKSVSGPVTVNVKAGPTDAFKYSYFPDTDVTSSNDLLFNVNNRIISTDYITGQNQNIYINFGAHFLPISDRNYLVDTRLGVLANSINGTVNNWRPEIYNLAVAYNPFYINGNSGEETLIDYLDVFAGTYRIFSTDANTLMKYVDSPEANVKDDGVNSYTNQAYHYNQVSRAHGLPIVRNILTAAMPGQGVSNFKEEIMPTSTVFRPNQTSPLFNSRYSIRPNEKGVEKHLIMKQFFRLPSITQNSGNYAELTGISLTYNNVSSEDKHYAQDFPYIENPPNFTRINESNEEVVVAPIEYTNTTYFKPSGVQDSNGNNIVNFRDVFANDSSTGGGWQSYGMDSLITNGTGYKTVQLKYKFEPPYLKSTQSATGTVDSYKEDSFGTSGIDMLGRNTQISKITIKQVIADMATGATQTYTGGNVIARERTTSAFADESIEFVVHGQCWPEYFVRVRDMIGAELGGPCYLTSDKLVDTTLYSTEYVHNNSITGHNITGSTRPALSTLTQGDFTQELPVATSYLTLAGEESLTNFYASVDNTTESYWKKYPVSGQFAYKYENYFAQKRYSNKVSSQESDGSGGNYEWINNYAVAGEYGIQPGPVLPGRFDSTGDNAVSAYLKRERIFKATAQYNSAAGTYETFIPIQIENYSHYPVNLISIELDNYVGNAESGLSGMGDPRFIYGQGDVTLSGSNVVADNGEFYQTPISDDPSTSAKAYTPDHIIKTCSLYPNNTEITLSDLNNIYIGQRVYGEQYVPDNTVVTEIDAVNTTVTLSNGLTGAATTLLFDSKHKDYITWDIVRGKRDSSSTSGLNKFPLESSLDVTVNNITTQSGSQTVTGNISANDFSLYRKANGGMNDVTGNPLQERVPELIGCLVIGDGIVPGTKVTGVFTNSITISIAATQTSATASLRFVHPDRLTVSSEFIQASGTTTTNALGAEKSGSSFKIDVKEKGTIVPGGTNTSLYSEPTSLTTGAPSIYFAADASKLSENNLDTGVFYNQVRVKYIVWDKADMFGANYEGIDISTINRYDFKLGNGNKAHVYEDVYLVKVDFTNLLPVISVSDIEGDSYQTNGVINFGTLKTN